MQDLYKLKTDTSQQGGSGGQEVSLLAEDILMVDSGRGRIGFL